MRASLHLRLVHLLLTASLAGSPVLAQEVCQGPWSLVETLRIGSHEGDVLQTHVQALELGPTGDIYLTQVMTPHVTVLTPDGRFSRTIGRAGQGPGEFWFWADKLGWKGDSLWVHSSEKITIFGPDGRPAEEVGFRLRMPEEGSIFVPRVLLGDGSVLATRSVFDEATHAEGNPTVAVRRFSRAGEVRDTIALISQAGRFVSVVSGRTGRTGYYDHPFEQFLNDRLYQSSELGALTQDGLSIVAIGEVRVDEPEPSFFRLPFARAETGAFQLLQIAISGDTLLDRSIPYEPRRLSWGERRRFRELFAAWTAGDYYQRTGNVGRVPPVSEASRRAGRDAFEAPDYFPPVRQIGTGVDGSIWLLRAFRPDGVDRWEVYDEQGGYEGYVEIAEGRSSYLPWAPRLKLLRASRDELWGMTLDELDVAYVHKYRIDRTCG